MAVRLVVTEEGDPRSEYIRSFLQNRIVIGRARSSDICLPDMAVSTRHAEIRLQANDYVLIDLESINGTRLNGKKLMPFRPRLLSNGDEIGVANFQMIFNLGVATGPEEPRDMSLRHARDMLANVLSRSGVNRETQYLVVISGPHPASRFELPKGPATLTLGRSGEVDIVLNDRDISREHAEITVDSAAGVTVRDLGSRNGIMVDGRRVTSAKLTAGNHFTLGKTTIALENTADRTLGVIFEAPEEDTSSFVMMVGSAAVSPPNEDSEAAIPAPNASNAANLSPAVAEGNRTPGPSVGPADPLVGSETDHRTHRELPIVDGPRRSDDKTDAGLIIVGAIILLASVAALIYLFS